MNNCNFCGKPVGANDKFCKGCGAPVAPTPQQMNQNQQMDNPYSIDNNNDNPYGQPNSNDDKPFANDNPFSGGVDNSFPKADNQNMNDNPFDGDKSVTDQKFVNPKVESYNDVDHLPTLSSQIKSDDKGTPGI